MTNVDFIIPLVRDDLRKRREVNQYVVDEVFPVRIIASKLHDWRQAYRSGGPLIISSHFDTIFSIIVNLKSVDDSTKREAWESVLKALVSETDQLKTLLELEPQDIEKPLRHQHLNCVKMLVYLLTQLTDQLYQQTVTKIIEGKGRTKSTKDNSNEVECERGIQIILKLMELPVHKLWDPPVPEEEFINLVTNMCYKTLENSSINRNKGCRDACVHVIGVIIRRYNYSLAASVKLLQLVQNHEHLVAPLAQAVVVYATDYDTKSIVDDVVREISRMNISESRDTSGMHHVAVFLSDIAEKGAAILLPHMARLTPFLDEESYQMRNCILSVMGEIMIQALGNDNLELRQKQARDAYLDHFEDHVHDVNAFVRSKSLQIWLHMINNKVVPLNRRHDLLELVLGRLQDVSSQVRKQAVQVVAALVKSDPFAAKLSLDDLETNYQKELDKLKEMMPEKEKSPEKKKKNAEEGSEDEEENVEKDEESPEAVTDAEILNTSDPDKIVDSEEPVDSEIAKQKVLVQYLKDSVAFVSQVQRASCLISQLLGSKSITDVLEAVDFFVTCSEFGLPSVDTGVRTMLNLVWSKEASVKEAVVRAYKRLYLEARMDCSRNRAYSVVKNLCRLLTGATKGHMTSMEELVRELMKSGEIDNAIIQMLWEVFTMKVPSSSPEESRLALTLLAMVASEAESVARTNINVIVEQGLGIRAENDLSLARDACVLLMKIGKTKDKSENSEQFRLPLDHEVFVRLNSLLVKGFTSCNTRWIPFMEQALDVIYKMAEHPDLFATRIVQRLAMEISQIMPQEKGGGDIFPGPTDEESRDSQNSGKEPVLDDIVPTDQLSFFLSICGQVAVKQLVFLDVDIFGELKRRHQIMENKQEQQRNDKNSNKRRKSMNASKKKEAEDDDIGLGDAPNEDQDAEFIRRVCEDEIVTGEQILASVAPLIVSVCSHPNLYPDEGLQSAAVLALAKYMLVSSVFCEEKLPLLFTILEKSDSCVIRANCIVALGDMTFRFPNLIEPWTPNLYACLRDDTPQVRRNTVMMLTHLILNDMVKVKGQISEMAVCILDEDQRIANLAKLFFSELATKGNAMYNILPDAISRLSDPEKGVEEQPFRDILKFLLSFISKDRQCEGLVEKFCQRFQACRSERQSRDLAFCLSLLQYSEKCLRKLLENVGLYANTLGDPEVYRCFTVVLANAKKFPNAEAKAMVEELETRIEELHSKGATEEQIAANAKKASQAAKNFRKPGRGRGGRSPKKLIKTEPIEQASPLIQAARQKRSTRPAPKQTLTFSDSDDDLSSPVLKHKKPKPRKSRAVEFSSDSDE